MIAILAAMNKELAALKERMHDIQTSQVAGKTLHTGILGGRLVVLAQSGIGKVNAALTASLVLSRFDCECLINTGVAGGIAPAKPGDLILADRLVSFDADVTAIDPDLAFGQIYGEPACYLPDPNLFDAAKSHLTAQNETFSIGAIASGDRFVTELSTLGPIRRIEPNVVACDMEAQAVAQVAFHFQVPFLLLRGVSDIVESTDQTEAYQGGVERIARRTADFVGGFVKDHSWTRS